LATFLAQGVTAGLLLIAMKIPLLIAKKIANTHLPKTGIRQDLRFILCRLILNQQLIKIMKVL